MKKGYVKNKNFSLGKKFVKQDSMGRACPTWACSICKSKRFQKKAQAISHVLEEHKKKVLQ